MERSHSLSDQKNKSHKFMNILRSLAGTRWGPNPDLQRSFKINDRVWCISVSVCNCFKKSFKKTWHPPIRGTQNSNRCKNINANKRTYDGVWSNKNNNKSSLVTYLNNTFNYEAQKIMIIHSKNTIYNNKHTNVYINVKYCQQLHTDIYIKYTIHNNKYIYNTHIIDSTQHIPTYTPLKQPQQTYLKLISTNWDFIFFFYSCDNIIGVEDEPETISNVHESHQELVTKNKLLTSWNLYPLIIWI